jgi:hypothetical protein
MSSVSRVRLVGRDRCRLGDAKELPKSTPGQEEEQPVKSLVEGNVCANGITRCYGRTPSAVLDTLVSFIA